MLPDSTTAIEAVYAAFAHERPTGLRDHSPIISVSPAEFAALSRPLRQIDGSVLSRYAFKAMTTWGDTATFRYFLPALLDGGADLPLLADKLSYGGWKSWSTPQVESVRTALFAIANERMKSHCRWQDAIAAFWRLGLPVKPLFDHWLVGPQAWETLTDLIWFYLRHTPYPARDYSWTTAIQRWLLGDNVRQVLWESISLSLDPEVARRRDEAIDLVDLLDP